MNLNPQLGPATPRFVKFVLFMVVSLSLLLGVGMIGGGWGTAYGQTAGPTSPPSAGFLIISKTADRATVNPGDTFNYIITAQNAGNSDVQSVVVTDNISSNLKINAVTTTQGTEVTSGQNVQVNIGTVAAGQSVTITINVTDLAAPPSGAIRNVAQVSFAVGGLVFNKNSDPSDVAVGGLTTSNPGLPKTGQTSNPSDNIWQLGLVLAFSILLLLLVGVLALRRRNKRA